jgi:hypothetical protein
VAAINAQVVELPYAPRAAFLPFHNRTQRWAVLAVHRRAGKTIAGLNDIIRSAWLDSAQGALYAFCAPFRSQAKSVAWDMLKYYAQPLTAAVNEGELLLELHNGAKARLFGADNADAMRGLGFSGIFLDEYADFKPSVWGNVIRPALADRQGWAVFSSTPKGKNQFFSIWQTARRDPSDWFSLHLPASKSGLLPETELEATRAQISRDQYEQEMEVSFEAAILGAIWGIEMREATEGGRIRSVPVDPALPVHTAWDIGYKDATAIWWYQVVAGEIHLVDFYQASGLTVPDAVDVVMARGYRYGKHNLPHDARAKTFAAAGKSVIEQMAPALGLANMQIVPDIGIQPGISYTRDLLSRCWFDEDKCSEGIEALRQYQHEFDEDTKAFRKTPRHDWTSHCADAFRQMAVAWVQEPTVRAPAPERTLLVGPDNRATLNDMWAAHAQVERRKRI